MALPWWIWVIVGYLCGSAPFALLLGYCRGIDIRTIGSGNVGASNLGRALGRPWGFLCFALDALKGLLPVLLAGATLGYLRQKNLPADQAWRWLAVAAAAVLGHVFPIWLKFRGGKGVATGLGALLGLWPVLTVPALAAAVTWIIVLKLFRYISLASVVAALALPLYAACLGLWQQRQAAQLLPFLIVTAALGLLVALRHFSNLKRIAAGTERKVGRSTNPASPPPPAAPNSTP